MKIKSLLALGGVSLSLVAGAQTNWTASDINGNSHTLQDYLDQGKTVLVDISAYWCGPCWNWHHSGVMEELYNTFGPNGTDDLRIFWVDGDAATTMAYLEGAAGSQGDWITGTPYPIIGPNGQGQLVATQYAFTGFPTLFVHRPGSTTTETLDNGDFFPYEYSQLYPFLNLLRGSDPSPFSNAAVDGTLMNFNHGSEVCVGEVVGLHTDLYNAGSTAITSASVELKQNGSVIQTVNWTGNLANNAHATINFDNATINGPANFEVHLVTTNGGADGYTPGDADNIDFTTPTASVATSVEVTIVTDNYGAETYWQLVAPSGAVVAHGGNPLVGTTNIGNGTGTAPASAEAYANASTYTETVTLYEMGCYVFGMYDFYGDGICCAYGTGSYEVKDLTSNNVVISGGSFTASDLNRATNTAVGLDENTAKAGISIYPNPTNGIVNMVFAENTKATVDVFNVLGERVMTNTFNTNGTRTMDLSALNNGVYYLNVNAGNLVTTQKVTLNK